eukprot:1683899-Rhodomonas_salina.3
MEGRLGRGSRSGGGVGPGSRAQAGADSEVESRVETGSACRVEGRQRERRCGRLGGWREGAEVGLRVERGRR